MWYDGEAKKLYTIGLARGVEVGGTEYLAFIISRFIDRIRESTGDELCLDQGKSTAVSNQTLHLKSMLLVLFGMLLAIAIL